MVNVSHVLNTKLYLKIKEFALSLLVVLERKFLLMGHASLVKTMKFNLKIKHNVKFKHAQIHQYKCYKKMALALSVHYLQNQMKKANNVLLTNVIIMRSSLNLVPVKYVVIFRLLQILEFNVLSQNVILVNSSNWMEHVKNVGIIK